REAHAAVFLTATPLQTSDENLFNLLRLLSPDDFDTLDAFRDQMVPAQHLIELRRLARAGRNRWADSEWRERVLHRWRALAQSEHGRRILADPRFERALADLTGAMPDALRQFRVVAAMEALSAETLFELLREWGGSVDS